MNKIFVLGSLNMDLIMCSDRLPLVGETLTGNQFAMVAGGKGANQAVAAANMNANTVMLGSLGSDPLSSKLLDMLQQTGVDCTHVKTWENMHAGIASIWVIDGDNRIILDAGANAHHDLDAITHVLETKGSSGDLLISQFEIPLDVVKHTLSVARRLNIRTLINPAPAVPLDDDIYPLIDTMVLNETETEIICGHRPDDEQSTRDAAKSLLNKGVRDIIFTFGDKGATRIDNAGETQTLCAHDVEVIDTTAAGDTFIGVYAAAIVEGSTPLKALTIANAAAALSTTVLGAQSSIPKRNDVVEFLERVSADETDH